MDEYGKKRKAQYVIGPGGKKIRVSESQQPSGMESDSDEEDDKPPKILRFNGDKISLHKTNGNGNGRRAATGGASQIIASFPRPNHN